MTAEFGKRSLDGVAGRPELSSLISTMPLSPAGSSVPSRPLNGRVTLNAFVLQEQPEKEHPRELRGPSSRHNYLSLKKGH